MRSRGGRFGTGDGGFVFLLREILIFVIDLEIKFLTACSHFKKLL
jgi:hypothetical protein